ncbi:MAG: ATP-dependent metallopeptidase FtsH/Yme1/Tma family protein [Gammaproteobacteria bacterium]|nr:ATP-dependent metallopeptidase FtsH/Yme1/Tma family protein [Gammaproteobacteria bacterium]
MDRKTQLNFWYVALAALAILFIRDFWEAYRTVEPIPYSQFQEYLAEGRIAEVTVQERVLRGTLRTPMADGRSEFVTTRVEPDIAAELTR